MVAAAALGRGDVVDYTMGSRRIRVLLISANAYTRNYPVIVLVHNRAYGDVPGIRLAAAPSIFLGSGLPTRPHSVTDTAESPRHSQRGSTTVFAACLGLARRFS